MIFGTMLIFGGRLGLPPFEGEFDRYCICGHLSTIHLRPQLMTIRFVAQVFRRLLGSKRPSIEALEKLIFPEVDTAIFHIYMGTYARELMVMVERVRIAVSG